MMPLFAVSMEVDNNTVLAALLIGVVTLLGSLLAAVAAIKGWIRDVAGVKETSTTEIAGQPITVEFAKHYITREEFERDIQSLSDSMASDRADNKREHENLFSKLGGQERGIQSNLLDLGNKLAKVDERSEATQAELRLLNQNLMSYLREARNK